MSYTEPVVNASPFTSAAVVVLDHRPSEDELEYLATKHLEELDADEAFASIEVVYTPPAWLSVCERDQLSAHLRDGIRGTCIVIVYLGVGEIDDDEDELLHGEIEDDDDWDGPELN